MALKHLCSCGKVLDLSVKLCPECIEKYKVKKKQIDKDYDKYHRNKESKDIYHSRQWEQLTEQCKSKFQGLCIYSYYILGEIRYGSISHHVVELSEDIDRAYDIENLIYLDSGVHNYIHTLYKRDKAGTQQLLFSLIKRWQEEFEVK